MRLLRPALAATVLALATAGCGGGSGDAQPQLGAKAAAALEAGLVARHASPRWVTCVPTRYRVRDLTAVRCNVNFGDPHVEAYCAVLTGRRLSYLAWRHPEQGRQDRAAAMADCARRLSAAAGQTHR